MEEEEMERAGLLTSRSTLSFTYGSFIRPTTPKPPTTPGSEGGATPYNWIRRTNTSKSAPNERTPLNISNSE